MLNLPNTLISVIVSASLLSGCASIVSDSSYPVSITSTPSNISFEILNSSGQKIQTGTTPNMVMLDAGDGFFDGAEYTVVYKNNGKEIKRIALDSGVDGWYIFGNFFFGGLIGWLIVDPATGAMFTLPEGVLADLTNELNTSTTANQTSLKIMDINNVPAPLRNQLVAVN